MKPATSHSATQRRLRLELRGLVQGVGFRPFVYRIASELNLSGWVCNNSRGVLIEIEGRERETELFAQRLREELPPLARIDSLESTRVSPQGESQFRILHSDSQGAHNALVLPDIAICSECRAEIFDPTNRRHRYPFTNCTNCGPRFSIIEALPYDRAQTTMRNFVMCDSCRAEYEDPTNRRFHAQPNACPECGPLIELRDPLGKLLSRKNDALHETCELLRQGRVVALKGLGGFQLLVDARSESAVEELRRRKNRPSKPLALMCPSLESAASICEFGELEALLLQSPQAPVVLLPHRSDSVLIARSVAPDNPYLGVMLPYTPLHSLLMQELDFPIVATSGNLSDEPICIDNDEALARLSGIADYFLMHDRQIARQMDDSVVQVVDGQVMLLRAARGYAPTALRLSHDCEPTLAVGGHLKNSVAISFNMTAIVGQHIGDLDTLQATEAFLREVDSLQSLHELQLEQIAADLHPDYFSTTYADSLGTPVRHVQHHLAHVFSCMLENDCEPPVMGIAWDGAGLGTDGTIWGGEFIEIGENTWKRVAHLRKFRLPGGDAAARDPRRSALAVLYELLGEELTEHCALLDRLAIAAQERSTLLNMLKHNVNSPHTSSMGRLFDAVAALLGICMNSTFEGEAAMRLQFAAERSRSSDSYRFLIQERRKPLVLDWAPLIEDIIVDHDTGRSVEDIAMKFHNSLATAAVEVAEHLHAENVVLTGGCFQNRLLHELVAHKLRECGIEVFSHHLVPPNDGGLALGQLAADLRNKEEVN